MVQFKDVSKVYTGHITGVNQINFSIEEGEFVFFIGPSGSGKTTLIKMLIRDEKPSRGKIFFDDQDITHLRRSKIYKLRRQIGVIFQDYKLIHDKTAAENIEFSMEAAGKKRKEIKDTVPYVLDIVGLSDRMKSFPKELSGGEQQRVAIARAIANNPRILIADEPTGNLDPGSAWDIVQILNKINNWGTTVIMSTHGTDIVNSLNKRVIQMDRGQVVRDDSKGQYEFKRAYESRVIDEKREEKSPTPKKKFKVNISDTIKTKNDVEKKEKAKQKAQKQSRGLLDKVLRRKLSVNEVEEGEVEEHESTSSIEKTNLERKITELLDDQEKEKKKEGNSEKKKMSQSQADIKEEELHEHLLTNLSESTDATQANHTKNKKNKKNKKSKNSQVSAFIQKMSETEITELDIPDHLHADLRSAGYKTVADIIQDGPEKLSEGLVIDPEEVVKVARAIDKLKNKS